MRLNGGIRCNVEAHLFAQVLRIVVSGGPFGLHALLCSIQSSVEGRHTAGAHSRSREEDGV